MAEKFDLEELYKKVSKEIAKIDFSKLWEGFEPLKFALYDSEKCFFDGHFIEKTADFCANTAIKYNGEMIAIWNVQEELPMPILASKMVHEMFHGFQEKEGWTCFPNEMEALYKYKYSEENLSLKLYENRLLLDLLTGHDVVKYKNLMACRKYRAEKFPYEFSYECDGEEIEGSANYVEWQVLRQLDMKEADKIVEDMKRVMLQPEYFFPIRISGYYTGALLINAMISANDYCYKPEKRPVLIDKLSKLEAASLPELSKEDSLRVSNAIKAFNEKSKAIVESSVKAGDVVLTGPYELISVNIYDARCYEGHITSRFFLLYRNNGERTIINGNFVIKMADEKTIEKVYRWVSE